MTTKHKKGKIETVVEAAVDATEELGAAATSFKESWEHVRKAQSKAGPATRMAKRNIESAVKKVKKAVKR